MYYYVYNASVTVTRLRSFVSTLCSRCPLILQCQGERNCDDCNSDVKQLYNINDMSHGHAGLDPAYKQTTAYGLTIHPGLAKFRIVFAFQVILCGFLCALKKDETSQMINMYSVNEFV